MSCLKKQRQNRNLAIDRMSNRKQLIIANVLVLTCTIVAMFPTLLNGWTSWDDQVYVLNNQLIQHLNWEKIKIIFTTPQINGTYSPLVLVSWALNHAIHGFTPFGYHFLNLIIHLINTSLVLLLIRKLGGNAFVSIGAALLFGIHPLNVEAVAWVTGRKDVLYVCFALLSLVTYADYISHNRSSFRFLLLSLCFFFFALLSKATAVVLPVVLLLIDFKYGHSLNKRSFAEKIPYFSLALMFGALAVYAQSQTPALSALEDSNLLQPVLSAGYAHLLYFLKVIVPFKLAAFHPYPPSGSITVVLSVLGLVAWLLAMGGGIFLIRHDKTKLAGFGLLFFLIGILPVSQIIPVGSAIIADRYVYMPYIGLFVAIVSLADGIRKRVVVNPIAYYAVCTTLVLTFGFRAFTQSQTWKSDETLWTNVINEYPDCAKAFVNRGMYYAKSSRLDFAQSDFNQALMLEPTMLELHQQMGLLYQKKQEFQNAERSFRSALELNSEYEPVLLNQALNSAYLGDKEKAISELSNLIGINPENLLAYLNRGVLYEQQDRVELAITDYSKVIEMTPIDYRGYQYRTVLNYRLENYEDALQDARNWNFLQPENAKSQQWIDRIEEQMN